MGKRIGLITPMKDEKDKLLRLLKSVKYQSYPIYAWVIIENDSTDGTIEFLKKIKKIKNVKHLIIKNINHSDSNYDLDKKYSSIIIEGLNTLKRNNLYEDLDYIGILDSDTFPALNYYKEIVKKFTENDRYGIIGGYGKTYEGKTHLDNKDDPCGAAMVISKKCLSLTGYSTEPSAASIIRIKARLKNFIVENIFSTHIVTREMGAKFDSYKYAGELSYFLGRPMYHALLHSISLSLKGKINSGFEHFIGYLNSWIKRKDKINDTEVRNFYKTKLINRFLNKIGIKHNNY